MISPFPDYIETQNYAPVFRSRGISVIKVKKDKQLQENSWEAAQSSIAEKSGMAIVVVDEHSSALSKANNNSVCQTLYNSEKFAPECDKYCGKAFQMAAEAGKTVGYRCYANLDCRAVPVKDGEKIQLVAIVGRAFTKSENYRAATERAISGDWSVFPPTEFFENVLLSGSINDLENAAARVENLTDEERTSLFEFAAAQNLTENEQSAISEIPAENKSKAEKSKAEEVARLVEQFRGARANQMAFVADENPAQRNAEEAVQIAEWRSLFGSLLDLSYKKACVSVLQFLSRRYSLESLAWLDSRETRFNVVFGIGKFKNHQMQLGIPADDPRLLDAVRRETSLELRERKNEGEDEQNVESKAAVRLFPVAVGGEIKSGLLLVDGDTTENTRRHIARFCQTVASELEILKLREELSHRGWLAGAVRRFNENLQDIDSEDFWMNLARISAELMKAERTSLLILDEKTDLLTVKAALGAAAEQIKNEHHTLGARVAEKVLSGGKPLVVADVEKYGLPSAPVDWKYKSNSFISYPIEIGGRKIGVLNLTDKTGGETYGNLDLDMLNAIVPQLALLIDRAALKHKAGEFQQLSVTDALTGLLNRRYLEERLAEEIKRSNRNGFPMSFMMVDVDDFKAYNDNFSHPEGDKALKLVAQCLKETLRGADVAARYGGEEFSILLPQTNSVEAQIIAERIRERIESAKFPNRKVTVSIGVASCSQSVCTAVDIIKAADNALYEAKRRGRNNVQVYENLKEKEFNENRK